jgi:hypothetical protein
LRRSLKSVFQFHVSYDDHPALGKVLVSMMNMRNCCTVEDVRRGVEHSQILGKSSGLRIGLRVSAGAGP